MTSIDVTGHVDRRVFEDFILYKRPAFLIRISTEKLNRVAFFPNQSRILQFLRRILVDQEVGGKHFRLLSQFLLPSVVPVVLRLQTLILITF